MRRWMWMGAFMLAATGKAFAVPVGMASHVAGKAEVNSGGATKPLHLLQRLNAGDKVICGPGGAATIVLFGNGNRYQIAAGKSGVVQESNVTGAQALGGLSGPSGRVARALGGSRSGAVMARPAQQQHQAMPLNGPGWMVEGEAHFQWDAIPGAATYLFSLLDQNDNVVWHVRGDEMTADYPADLPALSLNRPYVWRLGALGKSGKALPDVRWGVITFLSKEDADKLTGEVQAFQQQIAKTPNDAAQQRLMLAELYRNYGVYEKVLSTLEDQSIANQPGIKEAIDDAYKQVSTYAQALHTSGNNTDDNAGTQ